MPRTFVELSTFGALEAQLGHGADSAQLEQDYLQHYAGVPAQVSRNQTTEIPLAPVPSWSNG